MRAFPGWTGADGYPLSWRHYRYGMGHLGRAIYGEKIRLADAVNYSQLSKPEDRARWMHEHRLHAGLV